MVGGTEIMAVPVYPSWLRQWMMRPSLLSRMHCGSEPNQRFHLWQSWSEATHQRPLSTTVPRYDARAPASPESLPSRA